MNLELKEILEGLLLGDGCLYRQNGIKTNAKYCHTSKFKGYLEYLSNRFQKFGIKQTGNIRSQTKKWSNGSISIAYLFATRTNKKFTPLYCKWYPNGKKIVPKDLKMTPIILREWYIGDGCLKTRKMWTSTVHLATQGFIEEDVDFLIRQLGKIGIIAAKNKYFGGGKISHGISISARSTKDFFEYMLPLPKKLESFYKYKWKYQLAKSTTSKYKGVYLHRKSGKWITQVCYNNKWFYAGNFNKEIDAARAYDNFIKENNLKKIGNFYELEKHKKAEIPGNRVSGQMGEHPERDSSEKEETG